MYLLRLVGMVEMPQELSIFNAVFAVHSDAGWMDRTAHKEKTLGMRRE
jgi:hypothetical protein